MIANQVSTDYLRTEDFARRPLAWLDLVSRNPGTSCSYSPTFGYDICARRVSSQTHVSERFDLSRWRLAGNGADMIGPMSCRISSTSLPTPVSAPARPPMASE
jgi:fatty-acyl-CoA synthase